MPTQSVPPEQREQGWSATAVALAIFLSGMAVVIVLVVWALTRSNDVTTAVAAPVIPAATQGATDMASMPGMESTAPAAASTAAAVARAEWQPRRAELRLLPRTRRTTPVFRP